jgi:hypothetical protein
MNWMIFYDIREPHGVYEGDGSEESIALAPTRGVQIIVQDHPEIGVEIVSGADYYVWRYDRWWGVDHFGLWDYICSDGLKKVLCGRTVLKDEYNELVRRANLTKDAWLKSERRPT